jgi:hypothetical protein
VLYDSQHYREQLLIPVDEEYHPTCYDGVCSNRNDELIYAEEDNLLHQLFYQAFCFMIL